MRVWHNILVTDELKLVSLRAYRAHRAARRLKSLPAELRTPERASPALQAIVDYAWEDAADGQAAEPARICARLEEFLPPEQAIVDEWQLMHWLYQNLVPEAWESPALMQGVVGEAIRQS